MVRVVLWCLTNWVLTHKISNSGCCVRICAVLHAPCCIDIEADSLPPQVFAEQLLTALWLYKDFPDVDLWVSWVD